MQAEFLSEHRHYLLALETDVFGTFMVFVRWHDMHSHRSGIRHQLFRKKTDAIREFKRIEREKVRNGFILLRMDDESN